MRQVLAGVRNGEEPDGLRGLVADVLGVAAERIDETFGPEQTASWDSLGHLRLVTAVEERFRIAFTMEEIGSIRCYGDLAATVRKRSRA